MPEETPVTKPLLSTVATDVVRDVHGLELAGVTVPANGKVFPLQTLEPPVIEAAGLTVIVTVSVHSLLLV